MKVCYHYSAGVGLVFAASATKHGYTVEDVLYAYTHIVKHAQFVHDGEMYIKFTGRHHGDPLVPSLEVIMKHTRDGRVIVFHVNAEQGDFWSKNQRGSTTERSR